MKSFVIRPGCKTLRRKLQEEGLPILAARVLSARDIAARQDIVPPLAALPHPDILPGMQILTGILADAVAGRQHIRVIGDYDADGMCATALTVICLRRLGATVDWRIPDRIKHGYGLNAEIAEEAANDKVKVLLTVDNGVSAADAVQRAKDLNMRVCVTDHHQPPDVLPPADCIVNPKLNGDDAPGANLAGVGVAFYAMASLRRKLQSDLKMTEFLDLVALGTIADCMPMDSVNRTLTGGGLARLRAGHGRKGFAAILAGSPRSMSDLTCRDISHLIAPRINAAGRISAAGGINADKKLNNADIAVKCLLADEYQDALQAAAQLSDLNQQRKEIVEKIMRQISEDMEQQGLRSERSAVVVSDEKWQPGVAGIIAGKLAERYHCPAMVFTFVQPPAGEQSCEGKWRGSGRAPAGWDLHQLLTDTAKRCKSEEWKFGGHRQAVGVSVPEVSEFARAFEECCRQAPKSEEPQWQVDEMPDAKDITPDAVLCLESMIWGEQFAYPRFAGEFTVSSQKLFGRDQQHLRMRLRGEGLDLPAIAFNRCQEVDKTTQAVFTLTQDNYTGQTMAVVEAVMN